MPKLPNLGQRDDGLCVIAERSDVELDVVFVRAAGDRERVPLRQR